MSSSEKGGIHMMNETKETITREECDALLTHREKFRLRINVILTVFMAVLCAPIIGAALSTTKSTPVLGFAVTVIFCVPTLVFIIRIILNVKALRLISRGGYSIVKDTVFSLSRGEFQKNAKHPVNAIYFSKYGRYVESGVEFNITSVGDEFYLVILEGKKAEIAYAFHAKMFEYKHI